MTNQVQQETAAHTPGPWDAGEPEGSTFSIFGADYPDGSERVIAHTYSAGDASLIAAAPDLLAALDGVSEWVDLIRQDYPELNTRGEFDAVRAAISKARGES